MNHLATIWTSPRATIREILDRNPRKFFLPLAATYGVVHNLHLVMRHEVDPITGATVLSVLFANVFLGALSGIVIFFVLSYLLAAVGRLFGGAPSSRAARTALAWASVPYVPLLIVIIPFMLVAGDTLIFYSQQDVFRGAAGAEPQVASLIYFLARGVMVIWSVVIGVIALSEAFGISAGKSFLLFILAGLVLIVLVIAAFILLGTLGIL